jgi:hypothetical protein
MAERYIWNGGQLVYEATRQIVPAPLEPLVHISALEGLEAIQKERERWEKVLPVGTYCICDDHGLLMPFRHCHWEWMPDEGCPVLVGEDLGGDERCGKPVQVVNPLAALDAAKGEDDD